MDELDVWRSAQLIITQYGERAESASATVPRSARLNGGPGMCRVLLARVSPAPKDSVASLSAWKIYLGRVLGRAAPFGALRHYELYCFHFTRLLFVRPALRRAAFENCHPNGLRAKPDLHNVSQGVAQ